MNYEDYVEQIRKFRVDSIVSCVTNACWNINSYKNEKDKRLVRTQAPRIFCIAIATGNNDGNKEANINDILSLSGEYIQIGESIENFQFINDEANKLEDAWKNDELLQKYQVDPNWWFQIAENLYIPRLEQSQWNTLNEDPMITYARGWILFKLLKDRCSRIERELLEKIISMFFQQKSIHAYRSMFAIFMIANNRQNKGVFDLNIATSDKDFEKKYGIDLETVRLVAAKMTTEPIEYRKWHDDILKLPEYYRKYKPIILYRSPLISKASATSKPYLFLCPSPEVFVQSTTDSFFREINCNRDIFGVKKIDIMGEQGNSLEDYLIKVLQEIFNGASIEKIEESSTDKKADFIIETKEAIFIIESKKSISSTEGRMTCSPAEVVSGWSRLLRSYIQCSETIKNKNLITNGKPVIAIVLVGKGNLFSIGSLFNQIAFALNIFSDLSIEYLEIMHLDEFEQLFWQRDSATIVNAIIEKWKKIKASQSPTFNDFRGLLLNDSIIKSGEAWLSCLRDSFIELFPGQKKYPWEIYE